METKKVVSIKKVGRGHVRNLCVNKNHTFVTSNGIVTHNCDLADARIMCLQSVLEGKPIFLPKLGKKIHPAKGFNVFATANTKGIEKKIVSKYATDYFGHVLSLRDQTVCDN